MGSLVLVEIDTNRNFETISGVAGRGGSINVASPVVAGGMIYLSSGYDFPPEVTGNVLLGFSVD